MELVGCCEFVVYRTDNKLFHTNFSVIKNYMLAKAGGETHITVTPATSFDHLLAIIVRILTPCYGIDRTEMTPLIRLILIMSTKVFQLLY